ncbi:hypothetical protein [Gimesia algae]|nr:hypothetical protein [Gimesia algae]
MLLTRIGLTLFSLVIMSPAQACYSEEPNSARELIVWGKLQVGCNIQAGISVTPVKERYQTGDRIWVHYHFRNCSQQKMEATLPNRLPPYLCKSFLACDEQGHPLEVKRNPGGEAVLAGAKAAVIAPGQRSSTKGFRITLAASSKTSNYGPLPVRQALSTMSAEHQAVLEEAKKRPLPDFITAVEMSGTPIVQHQNQLYLGAVVVVGQQKTVKLKSTIPALFRGSSSKYIETGELILHFK